MCATFPTHIILIILGEEYKLWISLIMQFSQTFCRFISLWFKYSPPNPVLKCPQSMLLRLRYSRQLRGISIAIDWKQMMKNVQYLDLRRLNKPVGAI
jgi:hypothetical protein